MIKLKYKKIQCKGIITSVIDNLQLTDVQVVFDDKQTLAQNLRTHAQIAFLNAIDDDNERAAYEKKTEEEKSSYVTQSSRIHFPDLSVYEFIELLQSDASDSYGVTRAAANNVEMKFPCPLEIRSILFVFLHETGHWYQLMDKCKGRVKEYSEIDREVSEKIFYAQQELQSKIVNGLPSPQEKKKIISLRDEYRKIPKEAYADKFAETKMAELDKLTY